MDLALARPTWGKMGIGVEAVKPSESASYRLRLAQGFLDEARQDANTGRWRSCVDNAQLAAEHALKAVVALWGPVSKTHRPAARLMEMLDQRQIPQEFRTDVDKLVDAAEFFGPEIHARTDYGDEAGGLTPGRYSDKVTPATRWM